MRWRAPLGTALLVMLTIPTTGFGWFHSPFSRSSSRTAPATVYYCPVPVVAASAPYAVAPAFLPVSPTIPPVSPTILPVSPTIPPAAPPGQFAQPRPAPPSSTPEPPRAPDGMPRAGDSAQESRKTDQKFYDSYFVAGPARTPGGDRCPVTFWNLSGRSLALTVDGQARTLSAGQSVRLDLKRDFAWAVGGRVSERQQVPAPESGVEIVIRR
jgi:hypothetical protein